MKLLALALGFMAATVVADPSDPIPTPSPPDGCKDTTRFVLCLHHAGDHCDGVDEW